MVLLGLLPCMGRYEPIHLEIRWYNPLLDTRNRVLVMWFLQVLFIFACILGLFSVISYLLRHYGSAVKVYLIQTDRVPRSSKDSSWAKAERQRVLDLESLPDELK